MFKEKEENSTWEVDSFDRLVHKCDNVHMVVRGHNFVFLECDSCGTSAPDCLKLYFKLKYM